MHEMRLQNAFAFYFLNEFHEPVRDDLRLVSGSHAMQCPGLKWMMSLHQSASYSSDFSK